MDTLTHTVLGACLGEVIAGRQIGKKAIVIGALAANFPDIDVICYLWMEPTQAMLAHRGLSHSLLLNTVLTFLLASNLHHIFRIHKIPYGQRLLLVGSGLFTHLFLDCLNAYGTGLFEPFSDMRVSFNALYILDPFFTLPMAVAAVVLLVLRMNSPNRKLWSQTAMLLSSLYLVFCATNKIYVNNHVRQSMEKQHIATNDFYATPTPLNNLLWYIIIRQNDHYYTGYYSLLDEGLPGLQRVERNDSLLDPYKSLSSIQNLLHFSQGYYCVKQQDSGVVFNDMRFGQESGWLGSDAHFVFSFDIEEHNVAMLRVQKERVRSMRKEALAELYTRIRGD